MNRKPHTSSVLKTLSEDDQAALFEYLRTNTLADGVKWVFSNNGVRTSDSSLSEWRGWYDVQRRITSWRADASRLKQLLGTDGRIDPNLVPMLAECYFMAKAAEEGDAETFGKMAAIIQRHSKLEAMQQGHADKMKVADKRLKLQGAELDRKNKELQIKLDEQERQRKAAEAAMNKAVGDGGMTNETRDLIREAMGMKTDPA